MTFSTFKERVIQFRKKIEEYKSGHKTLDAAVSTAIDCLPYPFKQFAKIFWDGLEKEDKSTEEMLKLLENIEKSNEQSFGKLEIMISELIKNSVNHKDIQTIGNTIRTSNESITQIIDLLMKKTDLLIKESRVGDARPIQNEEQLENYYKLKLTSEVKIRDLFLDKLKKWVDNWDWSNRKSKPILLITGDPGVGKSWLAYRLVYRLMKEELLEDNRYNILQVAGPNIRKNILLNSYEEATDLKNQERSIFVLDDRGNASLSKSSSE